MLIFSEKHIPAWTLDDTNHTVAANNNFGSNWHGTWLSAEGAGTVHNVARLVFPGAEMFARSPNEPGTAFVVNANGAGNNPQDHINVIISANNE